MSIQSFKCADTEALFHLRPVPRFVAIERTALRKLVQLDTASAFSGVMEMPKKSKLSTTTETRQLEPVSPGEMLVEEFLKPLGLSNYRLAKEIRVPAQRIGEITAGRRAITADTDLRLCRFFGLSEGWWLRLQADHDIRRARVALAKELARIQPLKGT